MLYLLSHKLTQIQAANKILIETTLPNIADRWKELELPIDKDKNKINQISERIENVIKNKWKAAEEITKLCLKSDQIIKELSLNEKLFNGNKR